MTFKLPTSNVLVLGSNSIHCLLPSTLITRADALLGAHRLDEAVELADRQLKKLQGKVTLDTEEADELRYVYQRIGFQCLTETLFDDAGKHFFAGNLDPRVLISYYPELRGSLFTPDDSVDMFAGVTEYMPREDSIDDIISINLVRNYSPHLVPNTSTAPVAVELRDTLKVAATEMLKVFLRKWRTKRRDKEIERIELEGREQTAKTVNEVVDTVLVRLYTMSGETTDLLALIEGPNDIVVGEIESSLSESNRYDALCKLYRSRGEEAKLLSVWSKLVTGEAIDEDVHDPLENMFAYLIEKKDKDLIQEWGVWLLKWDSERALKLLTSVGGGKRGAKLPSADDATLLRRIHESDPAAGVQFVEHLVLQRRSQDPELHARLASIYVDQLLQCLEDESTSKLWRAKSASYSSSSSSTPTSFLSYFASTTPDSASKRTRLKTLFFLQTSKLYDFEAVKARLEGVNAEWSRVLALERAVVLGKLERHREALSLLIHTLHDSASAEAYCTLGGEVIPQKTSQALAERFSIPILAPPLPTRPAALNQRERSITVDEGLKKELTRVLLDVYMSGGEAMAESTARLLNAQAMNLDVLDVISDVPPTWPLHVLSSFLSRSFRRTLHSHHESQLIKALAASENLAVADSSWLALREAGAIVEEEEEDGGEDEELHEKIVSEVDGGGENEGLGLSVSLDEKASLRDHGHGREVRGYDVSEDDESVDLR
ncbi:hypothetical protein BDY19DRAFT_887852 [Irpex rosettiformis]|uniref:Uncharacterized protein n=1 Tax=Irpex rosettiformis TaxID=378272 RepID=A0ACB8U6Y5_9APHY|nr:hypothetical protein BDY19DRAFT_887852 [Irpex rosettiformis]